LIISRDVVFFIFFTDIPWKICTSVRKPSLGIWVGSS
jgi:hypothetical protein